MLDRYGGLLVPNRDHPLNRGKVAWWLTVPRSAGGGRWLDLMGRHNGLLTHMTATSGWRGTTRPGGRAHLLFDGVDDVVQVGAAPAIKCNNSPFSVCCWAKPNNDSYYRRVATRESSWLFGSYSNQLLFGMGTGSGWNSLVTFGAGAAISNGVWQHLCCTYDGTTARGYINGKLVGSPITAAVVTSANPVNLGNPDLSQPQYWGGPLDDIAIAVRCWSASEVAAIYRLSRVGYPGMLTRMGGATPFSPVIPATWYHVYANDGAGGPVNYASPIATATGLTYATAPLGLSSDNTFAVRSFNNISGHEDQNTTARVRIVVDAAGHDVTLRPNAPANLSATAAAAGTATVTWSYPALGQAAAPTGFHVYIGTPAVSYASAAATVAYTAGRVSYSATLSGLADDTIYAVGVRAYNATAEEPNTTTVTVTGSADAPDPVDSLAGTIS